MSAGRQVLVRFLDGPLAGDEQLLEWRTLYGMPPIAFAAGS